MREKRELLLTMSLLTAGVLALSVLGMAEVPFITPKVLDPVVLGTSVNLTCASYSTDTFNLTWSVNGHLLANAVEEESLTFTVDLVSTDNYTSYTCTSQNTFGMNSTSITLEQAVPPLVTVVANSTVMVTVNASFLLEVTISRYNLQPVTVQWKRNNFTLSSGEKYQLNSNTSQVGFGLSILTALFTESLVDNGTYTVTASNAAGNSNTEDFEVVIMIAPQAAIMDSQKPTLSISEGGSGALTCIATGVPAPAISWFMDGVLLGDDDDVTLEITSSTKETMTTLNVTSTLNTTRVMRESAFATITCNASNGVSDSSSDSTQLLVQFAPNKTAISANQVVASPDPVSFSCTVDSYPTSTITWLHNGAEVLAAHPRVTISTVQVDNRTQESNLTLLNTTSEDIGTYTCSALNTEGSANMTTELQVWEPPDAPNGLTVTIIADDTTPVMALISWMVLMEGATGIPPGGNQTLRYFVELSNSSSAALFSSTVDHPNDTVEAPYLPSCENLTVFVTAENLFFNGTSASEDFTTVEPVLPAVTVSTVDSTADYPAGSNISLQCSWNTSVYYVAWYKNGTLLYEEDLAAHSILMRQPQWITVDSDFTLMTSNMNIDGAAFDDSGNYTCAVTCRDKGVEFGMIAENLQDTTEVFVYEPPNAPNGLMVDIQPDNTTPVTAITSWMALIDSTTGIPPGGNQTLRYFVEVSNSSSAVLFSGTVDHPISTVEAPNLPACANLTVVVTAENLFFSGNSASQTFMRVEPVLPTVTVSTIDSTSEYPAGSNISLQCSWNTSQYYVAWYKNNILLYEEDLAVPYVLMRPSQGMTLSTDFTLMTSNLIIDGAAFDDSGNYTCAVTCGAKGVELGMIATNLQDTTEVSVYELPNTPNGLSVVIKADDTTPVTALISWMALMEGATGIPPGGNQTLRYFVELSNSSSAVLFSGTVDHPNDTVEAPYLPSCENLTVFVTAENLFFNGTPASEDFMTVEPVLPTVTVSTVKSSSYYPAGSNISLQCSWNTSVYYVAWYKNSTLLYEEDLTIPSILMRLPQWITVDSDFTWMMSNLTIDGAAYNDSGNYTCAVTCWAKEVEFGMIVGNLQDATEVSVYAVSPPLCPMLSNVTNDSLVVSWYPPDIPSGDITDYEISLSGSRHYEFNFSDSHSKRASGLSCVACSNPPLSCVESSQPNQCTRCTVPGLSAATNYTVSVAAVSGAVTGASSSNITGQTMVFIPPLDDDLSKGNLTDVGVSLTVTVPITRCSQQNGPISHYQIIVVAYSPGASFNTTRQPNKVFTPDRYVSYVMAKLLPGQDMLVYIAAEFAATLFPDDNMFTLGSGGPNDNDNYTNPTLSQITAYAYFVICLPDTTPESLNDPLAQRVTDYTLAGYSSFGGVYVTPAEVFIQLHLQPVSKCTDWVGINTEAKLSNISTAISVSLQQNCSCSLSVQRQEFSCQNTANSQTVVFLATLSYTTLSGSVELPTLLTFWVTSGPAITVNSIQLHVETTCPVVITSLRSESCSISPPPALPTDVIVIAVAVCIAVPFVVAIIVAIVIAVVVACRKQSKYSLNHALPTPMDEYESIDSITQQPCHMTEREAVTNFTFGIEEGKVKTYEELPYEDNEEGQGDAISGDHNAAADDMHVYANQ